MQRLTVCVAKKSVRLWRKCKGGSLNESSVNCVYQVRVFVIWLMMSRETNESWPTRSRDICRQKDDLVKLGKVQLSHCFDVTNYSVAAANGGLTSNVDPHPAPAAAGPAH